LPRDGRITKQALSAWWKTQVLVSDPHAGLVGLENGAGQQVPADRLGLALERRRARLQQVGQRALADLQAEQVEQQALQALERDRLAEAQVEHEGAQVGAERRARLQAGRRVGPEAPGAARALAAEQRDPGDVGLDLGDADPVVGVDRALHHAPDIGPAVAAPLGQHIAPARRLRVQGAVAAGMGLGLGPRRTGAIGLVAA
jgi:hypothetical protein